MATSQPVHQWHGEVSQKAAQDSSKQPFTENFDAFVHQTIEEFPAPGISIATIHGSNSWSKAYGYTHPDKETPVTPKTLFYTASTTKSFTAATAAKVVESKEPGLEEIDWSTKLVNMIRDDFVLQNEHTTNLITMVDALSHRTGMPRHDFVWMNGPLGVRNQTRALRHLPLHDELRSNMEYCNSMFTATSHALETVTGKKMETLLHDYFWDPLDMTSTFYFESDARKYIETHSATSFATGTIYDEHNHTLHATPFSAIQPANGAGGMISNVLDYTKWMYAFMHPSSPDSTTSTNPITTAVVEALTAHNMPVPASPQFPSPHDSPTIYGLGLQTSTYRGQRLVEHNGSIAGYMTKMIWFPELEWGTVLMQNSYGLGFEVIGWKLIDDFLDSLLTPDSSNKLAGQVKTGRHDMASAARKSYGIKTTEHEDEAIRKRLYPAFTKGAKAMPPTLPLETYEGKYTHPAYGSLTLSLSPEAPNAETAASKAAISTTEVPVLYAHLQKASFLEVSVSLHHVNGDFWYAYKTCGPGSWIVDETARARFEVGVEGRVRALRWQCEPAIEELAEFSKEE